MVYKDAIGLITGAASGIGRAFALELASRGTHTILVDVSMQGLSETVAEIQKNNPESKVWTICADLGKEESFLEVAELIEHQAASVSILINAAGFGSRGLFADLDAETERNEVMVNVVATVKLTQLLLPYMRKYGAGLIINLCSHTGSFWPAPYMATYAATKAFCLSFTTSLWEECRRENIRVMALCPGATDTGFHKAASFTKQHTESPAANKKNLRSAKLLVKRALRAVPKNQPIVFDGLSTYIMAMLPRFLSVKLAITLAKSTLKPEKHRP